MDTPPTSVLEAVADYFTKSALVGISLFLHVITIKNTSENFLLPDFFQPGFNRILPGPFRWQQLMWIAAICACLVGTTLNIKSVIMKYYTYPTATIVCLLIGNFQLVGVN